MINPKLICCFALVGLGAVASPAAVDAKPSLEANKRYSVEPRFDWGSRDYVANCVDNTLVLRVDGQKGWRASVSGSSPAGSDLTVRNRVRAGEDVDVTFERKRDGYVRRFHVRCLPPAFPDYRFRRLAPGGPQLFSLQLGYRFAAIFNRDGVPVWWLRASGEPDNVQVLDDGTVAFDPVRASDYQTGDYEIRTLKGRLLRVVRGADATTADVHDIQLLPNGNYLIGTQALYKADISTYGGPPDATVIGAEIQEITADGDLVSTWRSRDHIGLEETGRWWDRDISEINGYDVVHWNSVELVGKHRMLLSFRHLDAVYMVDRRSGEVIWKLGGTETADSLDVVGDPEGEETFGGQHDARVGPGGSISIHDNRTGLTGSPRAVRYRIDSAAGVARYVDAVTDPRVPSSFCCGSARRDDSGGWLIGWGGDGRVGGYDAGGDLLFTLRLAVGFSYRALPIPEGVVKMKDLRAAMDAMGRR